MAFAFSISPTPLHMQDRERETARAIRAERIEVAVVEGGREGGREGAPADSGGDTMGKKKFHRRQTEEGRKSACMFPFGLASEFSPLRGGGGTRREMGGNRSQSDSLCKLFRPSIVFSLKSTLK